MNNKQSAIQQEYAGAELLLRSERDLKNYHAWLISHIVRHAQIRPDAKVLDFGSGPGILSSLFHKQTGIRPDGVEIDPRLREVFRSRGFTGYDSLRNARSDYDLIFSSNVLEHIEDDTAALRELFEHLKPGGQLILYLPAFHLLWTTLDNRVGHCRRYEKGDLVRKLEHCGYIIRSSYYCDSVGFFLALLFKLFGNQGGEPSPASLRIFDVVLLPLSKLIDILAHSFLGKNIFVSAIRP